MKSGVSVAGEGGEQLVAGFAGQDRPALLLPFPPPTSFHHSWTLVTDSLTSAQPPALIPAPLLCRPPP